RGADRRAARRYGVGTAGPAVPYGRRQAGRPSLRHQALAEDHLVVAVGVEVGQDGAGLVTVPGVQPADGLLAGARRRLGDEQPGAAAAGVVLGLAEQFAADVRPLRRRAEDEPVHAPGTLG